MDPRDREQNSAAAAPKLQWSIAALGEALPEINGIKGYAWVFGNADRMSRTILPGAFGTEPKTVPLLAYHDDMQPIGTATVTPDGQGLRYEATFARGVPRVDEVRALIRDKAIPAVSIGWLPTVDPIVMSSGDGSDDFFGPPPPTIFPAVDVVELSVVPVPAKPDVTLEAASLLGSRMTIADLVGVYEAVGNCTVLIQTGDGQGIEVDASCGASSDSKDAAAATQRTAHAAAMLRHAAEPDDNDPRALAAAADAAVDAARDAIADEDTVSTAALLAAADAALDKLLAVLGVPDPDEQDGDGGEGSGGDPFASGLRILELETAALDL